MPEGAIEAFDVGVLIWLARLDVVELHSLIRHQAINTWDRYSGPLSTRIASGLPRHSTSRSSVRTTRVSGIEASMTNA